MPKKPSTSKLTAAQRQRIQTLHSIKWSTAMIVKDVGCSRDAIYRWRDRESVQARPGQGRPTTRTPSVLRRVIRQAEALKVGKAPQLTARLGCSRTTARRVLKDIGAHPYHPEKVPLLTPKTIQDRFEFCNLYMEMDREKLLVLDEGHVDMISQPNPRNDVTWALKNPRIRRQVVKHPAKVNFLLAFWYEGKLPLIFYDENLNQTVYQGILTKHIIPVLLDIGLLLLQDGDASHRAKSTQTLLQESGCGFIPKEHYPGNSPQFNVAEHPISELKDYIATKEKHSLTQLKRLCQAWWQRYPQEKLQRMFDSYPKRMKACLGAKGGHFRL
jgi:Transposase/DDE superfamily endonuclease